AERHVVAGDRVWLSLALVLTDSGPEQEQAREAGGGAGQVDDSRAGEVLGADRRHQPAATEELVRDERVDEAREGDGEEDVDDELRALDHRAPDDGQGDGAEDELEEELRRRRGGAPGQRRQVHGEARVEAGGEPAAAEQPEGAPTAEGEAEAHRPVDDRGDREVGDHLGHHRPDVLHPAEPDFEHCEAGLHEHDQHGGDDHPDGVARDVGGGGRRRVGRKGGRRHQGQGEGGSQCKAEAFCHVHTVGSASRRLPCVESTKRWGGPLGKPHETRRAPTKQLTKARAAGTFPGVSSTMSNTSQQQGGSEKMYTMPQRALAEMLGTAALVLVGPGSVIATLTLAGKATPAVTEADPLAISLAFGLIITALVYAIGKVSGCHINPAVTFALAATKRFPWRELPVYWVAQVVGAVIGAFAIWGVFGQNA